MVLDRGGVAAGSLPVAVLEHVGARVSVVGLAGVPVGVRDTRRR